MPPVDPNDPEIMDRGALEREVGLWRKAEDQARRSERYAVKARRHGRRAVRWTKLAIVVGVVTLLLAGWAAYVSVRVFETRRDLDSALRDVQQLRDQ